MISAFNFLCFPSLNGGFSFKRTSTKSTFLFYMAIFTGIYGPKGIEVPNPIQSICTRWGTDPLSYGSYSHVRTKSSGSDYDILAESVGDRLFFAGEATNRHHPATMHGAYLSGLREASCILRAIRGRQSCPRKWIQKNTGPNSDMLVDLFKKPDMSFGQFLFVFDPLTEDPKSMGLMRVTFHFQNFDSEQFHKKETENNFEHNLNQPVQLYAVLSREQADGLQLVTGRNERKLTYLLKNFGLKLMGANALVLLGNSLIANIANARRGRGRTSISFGQQSAL
ncbi:unnamed protein product [Ilex paraguariensis]|uniref:Amine oxidase domain-containing protein n=1 Tax=Ilex paraguariensis TaxID=185542 RepID=A0ABC8UPS3_9AQUA